MLLAPKGASVNHARQKEEIRSHYNQRGEHVGKLVSQIFKVFYHEFPGSCWKSARKPVNVSASTDG